MRTLLVLGAVLLAAAAQAQTQQEVDAAKETYLQADKDMNAAYKKALSALEGDAESRLMDAQEVWGDYRAAIAEAQANVYSEGATRSLVYYTAMREVTDAHIARLRSLVDEVEAPAAEAPAEEEAPMEEEDTQTKLTRVLTGEAVNDLQQQLNTRLSQTSHLRSYFEVIVPSSGALADVLAKQGLDDEYLAWVQANPDQARQIAMLAVAQEQADRAGGGSDGWGAGDVIPVTEVVKRGGLQGTLGLIGQELLLRPKAPFQLYDYLHNNGGLAREVESFIDQAMEAA